MRQIKDRVGRKHSGRVGICLLLTLNSVAISFQEDPALAESQFSDYEIRVIRPRFFSKVKKLETSVGVMTLTNQSFVYSLLGYASLNWHFSESLAAEVNTAYGNSFDKKDKSLLDERFEISTTIMRTEHLANAKILFTPSYGKMNLPDGDMLYFDTYVAVGVGQTGVRYTYDHCEPPENYPEEVRSRIPSRPRERVVQYPTGSLSLAQRFFLTRETSARVGVDFQSFAYNSADGTCERTAEKKTEFHENIFLFTGWSKFF